MASRFQRAHRALDVGCGTGLSTRALVPTSDLVVGVDISEDMLRQADAFPGVAFVLAAGERLPFNEATFDLATVASAIHWLAPIALHEVRRILEEDGRLLIYDVWFRAEMDGVPEFGGWLTHISEARYPEVVKNPRPDLRAIGFELEWEEDLRREVAMSLAELVDYLMTHSERIAAVTSGRESEEEQRRLLADGAAQFFEGVHGRRLGFGIRAELFKAVRPHT